MAIVNPELVVCESGQDFSVTVSMTPPQDVAGWTVLATLRAYNGGPALATKTIGSGITVTTATGVFVVTFTAAELSQPPGNYVWSMERTNAGVAYPICEPSGFLIRSSASAATPTMTNLSEYLAYTGQSTPVAAQAIQFMMILATAEATCQRVCQRSFVRGSFTEYLSTTGTDTLALKETPVSSLTNVWFDARGFFGQGANAFSSETLMVSGTDYYLDIDTVTGVSMNGLVRRINRTWPLQARNVPTINLTPVYVPIPGAVKIQYIGGNSLVPYDLKAAVFQLAADRINSSQYGNTIVSESFESYAMSLGSAMDEAAKYGSVARTLNSLKRFTIGL